VLLTQQVDRLLCTPGLHTQHACSHHGDIVGLVYLARAIVTVFATWDLANLQRPVVVRLTWQQASGAAHDSEKNLNNLQAWRLCRM
jgi:hypothetical protein